MTMKCLGRPEVVFPDPRRWLRYAISLLHSYYEKNDSRPLAAQRPSDGRLSDCRPAGGSKSGCQPVTQKCSSATEVPDQEKKMLH